MSLLYQPIMVSGVNMTEHCIVASCFSIWWIFSPYGYTPLFPLSRLFSFSRNQFWNILLSSDDANIIRPTIKKDGHLFPPSHRVPATKKSLLPTYRSNEYIRRKHAVPYNVLYLLLHGRAKSELFCAFLFMVAYMPFGYSLSDISHFNSSHLR